MHYGDWIDMAREEAGSVVSKCYSQRAQGGWDENVISHLLLSALLGIGTEIVWEEGEITTQWDALKLKGRLETRHGDIAIKVRQWLNEELYIDGVAFYEAKRQYFNNKGEPCGFRAIKKEQIKSITDHTFACNAVLYDIEALAEEHYSLVDALPLHVLEAILSFPAAKRCPRDARRHAQDWTSVLLRNLRGWNLDFRKDAVDAINATLDSPMAPAFVVNAAVSAVPGLTPRLDRRPLDRYEGLAGAKLSPKGPGGGNMPTSRMG
jgi:hypothetical protein